MPANRSYKILFIRGAGVGGQLLARILRRRGHNVRVLKPETVIRKRPTGFDLILITTYSNTDFINLTAKALEVANRVGNARIVLGGPGFSEQPEAYLRHYKADYGLRGEADQTIETLFEAFERDGLSPHWSSIKHIPGLAYRAGNNRVFLNTNLPALSAEEIEWEITPTPRTRTRARVYFQRGCPNHCRFCSKWFGDRTRTAPLELIVGRVVQLVRSGIVHIHFDGELFLPRDEAIQFARAIIEQELRERFSLSSDFTVGSLTKPDGSPDEELIDLLIEAGFDYVGFGIESFSNRVLKELGKPQTMQQALGLLNYLRGQGIRGHMYLIRGTANCSPFEAFMDRYIELRACTHGFAPWTSATTWLEILPGTDMFDAYKHDPRRFRSIRSDRPLHPATNLDRMVKREILRCWMIPYDPLVDAARTLVELLWGMEERFAHMARTKSPEELKRLEHELRMARRVMRNLPETFAHRIHITTRKLFGSLLVDATKQEGFLESWRACLGRRAELIERKLAKKLDQDFKDTAKLPGFEYELLVEIVTSELMGMRLIPQSHIEHTIAQMFDNVVENHTGLGPMIEIPGLTTQDEMNRYTRSVIDFMAKKGRDGFVRELMSTDNPLLNLSKFLVGGQLRQPPFLGAMRLRRIREGEDSRPHLSLSVSARVRAAARTLPR